jgi:spore coat protein CotH
MIAVCLSSLNIQASPINAENPELQSSELPIVIIDTEGQTITSSTRIIANMGVINNGAGIINSVTDPYNEYDGKIGIEIRGHSSKGFDQKSYRIETQNSLGNNNNVSLMGMPKDNEWVLYGPYCDKSLIRNALVYNLAGEINTYAPRNRFCELVLNNGYQGVYLLIEKIKEDNNRVNITQLKPEDINEPEISGGYMFKKELSSDKGDHVIKLNSGLNLSVIEPKPEDILPAQSTWLKNYLNSFETALYGNNAAYTDFLDVQSLADNFLMVEFLKNVDGLRASTYFYKDRGDKIVCGPVWDYNLSLGNADYNYGWTAERWYHVDEKSWPFYWFDELLSRDSFWNQIE